MRQWLRRAARGQGGITLIELLVVITIMAFLGAIAVPNLARFAGRGQAEAYNAERYRVQTATDAYMTENRLKQILGSAPGSAAVTSFVGIPALGGDDLYPQYIRSPSASQGVGYCWSTSGTVRQVSGDPLPTC